jgi:glycosyltransferase involved in cell wall biosynthesis
MATPQVSAITPTHDATHLPALYDSLLRQTNDAWEWVVAPASDAERAVALRLGEQDRRVRVLPNFHSTSIGAIKRRAFDASATAWLLELDHDDLLADTCVERVLAAGGASPAFIYSDVVVFDQHKRTHGYSPAHGWETYEAKVNGKLSVVNRAFPATARALCEVYYIPDHVRVWHRDAYLARARRGLEGAGRRRPAHGHPHMAEPDRARSRRRGRGPALRHA